MSYKIVGTPENRTGKPYCKESF